MFYQVKYRLKGTLFFKKLLRVKADGLLENNQARFFILDDETRIEIPCTSEFIFSKERFLAVKASMESSIGQSIPTVQ
jgi:hypothetical protein